MVGWSNFSIDPDQRECVEGRSKKTLRRWDIKVENKEISINVIRRFIGDRPVVLRLRSIGQPGRERARKEIMGIVGCVISLFRLLIFRLSFNSNCSSRKALTAKNFRTETPEFLASVLTQCDNYLGKKINFGPVGQSAWRNLWRYRPMIRFERFRLIKAGNLAKNSRPGNAFQHESWIAFNKHK